MAVVSPLERGFPKVIDTPRGVFSKIYIIEIENKDLYIGISKIIVKFGLENLIYKWKR